MEVKTLSIVIPAYNEEHRLPGTLAALRSWEQSAPSAYRLREVFVVDDGSTDQTVMRVQEFAKTFPLLRLEMLEENQGKGAALRRGYLLAKGDWVLLADADMSTPWSEIDKLMAKALACGADLVMGSRALPESEIRIRQSFFREYLGKTFNVILRLLTHVRFKDTQCGFKLFKNTPLSQRIFKNLTIRRFAYDVEIVVQHLAHDSLIIEVPVIWEHKEESRVHPIKDGMEMLFSVLKYRLRMWVSKSKR